MPLDFSYFALLRCKVFQSNPPNTLKQLQQSVFTVSDQFDIRFLQRILLHGFLHRLMLCKSNNGEVFEYLR